MHEALACTGAGKHVSLKGKTLTKRETHLETRRKEAEPLYNKRKSDQICRSFAL